MSESSYDSSSNSDNGTDHGSYDRVHAEEAIVRTNEENLMKEIVGSDLRRGQAFRWLVLFMFLATTGVTISLTCFYLNEQDNDDFATSFVYFSRTVASTAERRAEAVVEVVSSISDVASAHANTTGASWPFVTLPDFEVNAAHYRRSTPVQSLQFLPLLQQEDVPFWGAYSDENQEWLADSYKVDNVSGSIGANIVPFVWEVDQKNFTKKPSNTTILQYLPVEWQVSPPPSLADETINRNALASPWMADVLAALLDSRGNILHQAIDFSKNESFVVQSPQTTLFAPIFKERRNPESEVVAIIGVTFLWVTFLQDILPAPTAEIQIVAKTTCGNEFSQASTYVIDSQSTRYLSDTDMHDSNFDAYELPVELPQFNAGREVMYSENDCSYSLSVYPTEKLADYYKTNSPKHFAGVIAIAFFVMALTFGVYEQMLKSKNDKIVAAAARSNKLVSSLFPSNVRDRLLADERKSQEQSAFKTSATKTELKGFLAEGNDFRPDTQDIVYQEKPIADLFTDTTILFADISGFTAWSSVREPSQVFTLLETLYAAFDEIARKRRVYKVETIGDCYVAVTGLPEPRKDHAIVMARFARDCMERMRVLVKRLEPVLGPDTSDLSMRFGLHSGSVTAGVLRGERSRFQLFGDTMNTAARMEHTGVRGRIQLSQDTADLLIAAGKAHWVEPREETVIAKGKGEMQTYWLDDGTSDQLGFSENASSSSIDRSTALRRKPESDQASSNGIANEKISRLVEWNVQVLKRLLQKIAARRGPFLTSVVGSDVEREFNAMAQSTDVIDEVREIITLPTFDAGSTKQNINPEKVVLDKEVEAQLKAWVEHIAENYRDNAFHSFDHASHVTMSVVKLLGRIVAPDLDLSKSDAVESTLHDHTFGIVSDPITQFACIFSALIHDVDHNGVPNTQLVKENDPLALHYKNASVAEQRSVDLAWDHLMLPKYSDLRAAIYATEAEMKRFRQLVVNSVMATDIMDKDLKRLRNARWERAFDKDIDENSAYNTNRKATIVIEHLIQASDVAHTMQHWHVYRKWNEKLFQEMNLAYQTGRATTNPAEGWYKGELGFFDFYIIPLAKKLKNCGVFGVSSDEYLNYAEKNRLEWEERGQEVVAEMVEKYQKKQLI